MNGEHDNKCATAYCEVWEKVLASPLYRQTRVLFRQIFKRDFGFDDLEAMGIRNIAEEEWARIHELRKEPLISTPFCKLIHETKEGKRRCGADHKQSLVRRSSVREHDIHTCHAGLTEIAVPIRFAGIYYGCVALKGGGLLLHEPNEAEWDRIAARVKNTGVDLDALRKTYFEITPTTPELLDVIIDLLYTVVVEVMKAVITIEETKRRIVDSEQALYEKYNFGKIIGKSSKMQDVFALLARVAESESPILIEGESGTGKELVANTVHYNSLRKHGRFTPINCAAFNESLLESELFGHLKGSFTGATRDKKGLFEVTDHGTFFMDEISEMSQALQAKLLRLIQDGTFLPVGGTETRKANVRIISATNKNLKELVDKGDFREDLYYRLNVIKISLPSLREHKEDIPLLIKHFLEQAGKSGKKKITAAEPAALKILMDYDWPGNVRELQNVIDRAVAFANSRHITVEDLPEEIVNWERPGYPKAGVADTCLSYGQAMNKAQREYLSMTLDQTRGNVTRAAEQADVSRRTLQKLIKKIGITPGDFKA